MMAGVAVASSATKPRWFRRSAGLALALVLLDACAPYNSGFDAGEVLYAWQAPQRPKSEQKVERQRPPQPKPQPRPEPQRPPDPRPKGSDDAIPVAAATAEPGVAIGGLSGAIWADLDNDGYVDGYVVNGQYYAGAPQGYDPTLRRVVTGPGLGSVAAAGEVIGGVGVLEGAVVGAPVGGLNGAIWADRDNDGRADGFVYNGQYYPGAPPAIMITPAPMPDYSGERGW
jgi:hypothetical protein